MCPVRTRTVTPLWCVCVWVGVGCIGSRRGSLCLSNMCKCADVFVCAWVGGWVVLSISNNDSDIIVMCVWWGLCVWVCVSLCMQA